MATDHDTYWADIKSVDIMHRGKAKLIFNVDLARFSEYFCPPHYGHENWDNCNKIHQTTRQTTSYDVVLKIKLELSSLNARDLTHN